MARRLETCLICDADNPEREHKTVADKINANVCLDCLELYGDRVGEMRRLAVQQRVNSPLNDWLPRQPCRKDDAVQVCASPYSEAMDQVRILREARGWTQQHLADAAELSLRTVQRVEAGEVTPSKETLAALSGAFDVQLQADEGPHVIVKHDDDYLPGCKLNVVKDNFQVACVMEVNSRSRTATRAGLVLLDLMKELDEGRVEFEETRERFDVSDGAYKVRVYLDGELWDGLDHPVTFPYDAVLVRGPQEVISHAVSGGKIPRHWVVLPT